MSTVVYAIGMVLGVWTLLRVGVGIAIRWRDARDRARVARLERYTLAVAAGWPWRIEDMQVLVSHGVVEAAQALMQDVDDAAAEARQKAARGAGQKATIRPPGAPEKGGQEAGKG